MRKHGLKNGPTRDWVRVRMMLLGALLLLIWMGLWYRAYHVQIVKGPELKLMAARQHKAAEFERGMRGEIFDRRGRLLAKSTAIQSVYVRPLELEDPGHAATVLSAALDMPAGKVAGLIKKQKNFVWLARQISDRNAKKIMSAKLRGVYLTEESARFYPHGHLAGQLLGFVGVDGDGLEGVELSFDHVLQGKKATFVAQRDAAGRRMYLDAQGREEDLRGKNITLTLDAQVQFFAEEALANAVQDFNAKSGLALVVHVPSAEILAMANYPFFNPNQQRLNSEQWRNRVILDALEPGSTLKPMLMAAALEENVVDHDTLYFCEEGRWRVTNVTIRDVKARGWLPANKIIRYSSNICSAKIGLDLGATLYHGYLRKLGFGERTSLPLSGENSGQLRSPESWYPVDLAAVSFGQGMSATAVQMARAYLTLANNGVMRPLRIVREPKQELPDMEVIFRQEVAQTVMSMLREVVQEEGGTGAAARIAGIVGAGKTGTAQKATPEGRYGDKYMASFAGFYPGQNPEYFIYVAVDEPAPQHYGGVVAAPAVREIGLRALAYAGKLPESGPVLEAAREYTQADGASRVVLDPLLNPATAGKDVVPDVVGMSVRRAVERLRGYGVMPTVEGGGGMVAKQQPEPGRHWPEHNRELTIWLGMSRG
jgi:cell division protein FtsI (penicillin-binding protein 3)